MIRLTHKEEAEQAKADPKEAKAEPAAEASKAPPRPPATLKEELEAQLAEYMRKGAAGDEAHIHTLRTRLANLK